MAAKTSVLFDLNVVLDVLQKREPHYTNSSQVITLAEIGEVNGFLCANSMTTLFYIMEKNSSPAVVKANITSLLQFLSIAPVDQTTIDQALNLDYPDFEDAVQMISAVQLRLDYLVSRNPKDFQPSLIPVMQPVDFLTLF